jgi:phosphoribosylformylglycinamidine cyclo-ligase
VRSLPDGLGVDVEVAGWPRPAVFDWLQEAGGIEEREMLRTFNCGIGMVMIVPEERAAGLLSSLQDRGTDCFDMGAVVPRAEQPRVRFLG